ncbi:MAG: S41 family peptidase [bacterium]
MRKRSFLITGMLFLLIFVFVGVVREKRVQATAETYEQLNIFSEVLHLLQQNYVEDVDTKKLIYGAINGMVNSLDPHSGFMEPDTYKELQVDTQGKFGGIGIQIAIKNKELTIIAPIEDTPGFQAGLKSGDVILKVDESSTKDMSLMDAVKLMRGEPGTKVTLTIMRGEFKLPKKFELKRAIINVKSVKFKAIDDNIGYIHLTQFQQESGKELTNALKQLTKDNKVSSMILDLRNNPGGLLDQAVEVCGKFLPKGTLVVYTQGRSEQRHDYKTMEDSDFTKIPMVVLVNGGSASASEIVAGALQDWARAIVLGTQTFGKGSVQTVIPLSDGSGLRLTTAKYYTPRDKSIQNVGITPDIAVEDRVIIKSKEGEEYHMIKESELEHHLDNPDIENMPQDQEQNPKIDKDKTETQEIKKPEESDYQLQQAVALLKGLKILEEKKPLLNSK